MQSNGLSHARTFNKEAFGSCVLVLTSMAASLAPLFVIFVVVISFIITSHLFQAGKFRQDGLVKYGF